MMRNDHTFFFPERPNASKCNPPPLRAVLIPPILCRSVDCHVAVMLVTPSSGHVNNCSPTKFSVRAPDPSANITFTAYGKYGQRSVRTPRDGGGDWKRDFEFQQLPPIAYNSTLTPSCHTTR